VEVPSSSRREVAIAVLAIVAIVVHLTLWPVRPLQVALALGGLPLIVGLGRELLRRNFSSDLLAGISIVTSVLLGEYLAGTLVVLMLSGGQALEAYAVGRASSALSALAKRLPSIAHRRTGGTGQETEDIPLAAVEPGDELVVFPHQACPVDGIVIEGRSTMDESYLTGEPYLLSKTVGASVLSGAVNGEGVLTIRAEKRAVDSRYARIMEVMRESEQRRPALRRLGDQLGAYYTPLAVGVAVAAWAITGDPRRFLAVMVVATPCPLLIAIPVAIIGSVSLAARRGIIIKDPAALETIATCRTAIFDKTGTLTYGQPEVTAVHAAAGFTGNEVLSAVASLERYSRHPLSAAILARAVADQAPTMDAVEVSERPGQGLRGRVDGRDVQVTSRRALAATDPEGVAALPPIEGGLECVAAINGKAAGLIRFRDEPRSDGRSFVSHLGPQHGFTRVMLVSGDRDSEVRYLAEKVGITEIHASQSPEQKLALVRAETARSPTVFMGDGINDAPALTAATVGIAFGQASDVTAEAASVVIMDSSLGRVDELLHIGKRMRAIALQSAVGGMILSVVGMGLAAAGYLPPVTGAIAQELIDVFAVLNALRASVAPSSLTDM
jgi:heavy metal translocating P-type ATPase